MKSPVIWSFIFLIMIVASSCISITEHPEVISVEDPEGGVGSGCLEENGSVSLKKTDFRQPLGNLNSKGFTLLNWNSYKGSKKGWIKDLERFSENTDVIVLQEAHLTEDLKEMLDRYDLKWNMANAFYYKDIPTGTLTASQVYPEARCSFQTMEPVSGIPKSVLLSRYNLSGTSKKLLLANLHLINFALENSSYQEQLQTVFRAVIQHDGPFILAGDLNSWNNKRQTILHEFIDQLGMETVTFEDDKRSTFVGNHVDHIFYHGLVLVHSRSDAVETSDHNPLFATFTFQEKN